MSQLIALGLFRSRCEGRLELDNPRTLDVRVRPRLVELGLELVALFDQIGAMVAQILDRAFVLRYGRATRREIGAQPPHVVQRDPAQLTRDLEIAPLLRIELELAITVRV